MNTDYDAIVCNLPYTSKSANLKNAPDHFKDETGMKLGYRLLFEMMHNSNNVIALVPWFTIVDSDVRMRYIKSYGLKSITALPRSTFDYIRIQTCVLEMEKGYVGETEFKVFDLLDKSNKHNIPKLDL